jgi:hypothetical protein
MRGLKSLFLAVLYFSAVKGHDSGSCKGQEPCKGFKVEGDLDKASVVFVGEFHSRSFETLVCVQSLLDDSDAEKDTHSVLFEYPKSGSLVKQPQSFQNMPLSQVPISVQIQEFCKENKKALKKCAGWDSASLVAESVQSKIQFARQSWVKAIYDHYQEVKSDKKLDMSINDEDGKLMGALKSFLAYDLGSFSVYLELSRQDLLKQIKEKRLNGQSYDTIFSEFHELNPFTEKGESYNDFHLTERFYYKYTKDVSKARSNEMSTAAFAAIKDPGVKQVIVISGRGHTEDVRGGKKNQPNREHTAFLWMQAEDSETPQECQSPASP